MTTDDLGGGEAVVLRPATATDLPAVRGLVLGTMRGDHRIEPQPRFTTDLDPAQEFYLREPRALMVVAEAAGEVVATGGVRPFRVRGPEVVQRRYRGRDDVGELVRFAVAPQHRRRGLARQVLNCVVDRAGGLGYTVLTLHTQAITPTSAVPFWARMGAQCLYDERDRPGVDPALAAVYFDLPLPR